MYYLYGVGEVKRGKNGDQDVVEFRLIVVFYNVKQFFCFVEMFVVVFVDGQNFFVICGYEVFEVDIFFVFCFFDE